MRHDTTTRWELDPSWHHIDSQGHEHQYTITDGRFTLPTLNHIRIRSNITGLVTEEYYECKICCERVEIGKRENTFRTYIRGLK